MAITINGSGTITGVSAGGLPDNCITADDLATTLDLSGNTITLPSGTGGKVLQVVTAIDTTRVYSSSTSDTSTGHIVSITPSTTSSKVLVMMNFVIRKTGADNNIFGTVYRDINGGGYNNLYNGRGLMQVSQTYGDKTASMIFLDSPSTTSQCNYQPYFRNEIAGNFDFSPDSNRNVMIAMEIGA